MLKKFLKYIVYGSLSVLSLLVVVALLLNFTFFQNFLKDQAVRYLSNRLDTKVQMDHIRIDLFNKVAFKGLYIEDRNKDTLLYAQTFEGRLTDWLSVQKQVNLTYVKLDRAKVYLNRPTTDSVWNYQFILDAFARKDKDTTQQPLPIIALDHLELNSVQFDMWDGWFGSDMIASIGHLVMKGEAFRPEEQSIKIKRLTGDKIFYGLKSYKGGKEFIAKTFAERYPMDTTAFNKGNWDITIDNIALSNSHFRLRNEMSDLKQVATNEFDASYMDITNINIDIQNARIIKDTIFASIHQLTADERCGIKIKNLRAEAKVSPIISELKNLYLETNNSVLTDYYAMHYRRFPAFLHYIDSVEMEARLDNAVINMSDVAYFALPLNRWAGEVFKGSAYGKGTVANLHVKNINLTNGKTKIQGDYSIVGLPDINKSYMTYKGGAVQTDYQDLVRLFPEIKQLDIKQLEPLSSINYQGSFAGYYNDFSLDGTLRTNVGTVAADKFHISYTRGPILYHGRLRSSDGLNIATLFKDKELGQVAFDMQVQGDGFDYKKNNIKAAGDIAHFDYKGYRYRAIAATIDIASGVIATNINSKDEHAKLKMNGSISFTDKLPHYQFKGFIERLLPQQLGLYDEYLFVSGAVAGDIKASSFKNLVGELDAEDLFIVKGSDTLSVNQISMNSYRSGPANQFTFTSNGLTVHVDGEFYLDDLVASSQLFLSYYLPEIIRPPATVNPNQSFSFSIQGNNANDFLRFASERIKVSDNIRLIGNMDAMAQVMNLSGEVPYFIYDRIRFDSIAISSQADITAMRLGASVGTITTGGKILTRDVSLQTTTKDNNVIFELATGNEASFGTAKIQGAATARNDSFFFHLEPSELFFNDNKWDITSGGNIALAKDYIGISNLNIKSDDQWLRINNNIFHPNGNTLIALENINVKPLLQMLNIENDFVAGRIFGTINAPNLMVSPDASFDLYTDTILIDNNKIGYIQLKGNYDYANSRINFKAPSGIYDRIGELDLEGFVAIGEADTSMYNLNATARNTSLKWATPFIDNLVKNVDGFVNGNLQISGNDLTPDVKGKVLLSYAKFTPHITGVPYEIPKAIIDITPTQFIVNNAKIQDNEKNFGFVNGYIAHNNFSNIYFNLLLNSDNIKVLSLQEYEGENFYGNVYADARLSITGPLEQMNLDITAVPQGKSKLFIPLTGSADLSSYDYITFVPPDNAKEKQLTTTTKTSRINVNIDAVANENIEAVIIMDPISGEQIVAKGNGNITLFIPDEGQIRLNGNYNITEGYYDFTFNQLQLFNYKRRFAINDGSSINWSGDIANAAVNVKANTKVKARLYDLIINDIDRISPSLNEISDAQTPQNVLVELTMTGNLLNPDLKFNIDLEENRSIGSYAYQKLKRINTEDRELLNQVVSLLLVEQFMPPEGINSGAMAMNAGVNNISEVVSSFASGQLTNLTNRILGVEDLAVDFKYKYYNVADGSSASNSLLNRNVAGLSVRKNFFNDRIILHIGGIYDWGESSGNSVQTGLPSNLAGDFRLQYIITPDGRLRLNIFRTSNFDAIFLQNIGRHGVGLSYRRSFNNLHDFFYKNRITYPRLQAVDTATGNAIIDSNIISINPTL